MNLSKFFVFLGRGNKTLFDVSVQSQYAYMNSLKSPKNDFERSYNQFLCQEFFVPIWKRCIWWIIALLSLPFAVLLLWLKSFLVIFIHQVDTIAEKKGMDEILPDELTSKYNINHDAWNAGASLSTSDIKFLFSNVIGWRQPYFIFKILLMTSLYSSRITKYQPKRIIVHSEYSFCSSLMTAYCHFRNVKLINVMHGEKLRYIRDSFFHFDQCYVWDEHYIQLFKELHAEPTQFRVSVPPSLRINRQLFKNSSSFADFKYYLAADGESAIKDIVKLMTNIREQGYSIKYRIHPRYTNLQLLKKYVDEHDIEYPSTTSIRESISNTNYVVGSYTTVLLQAYLSGVKVVLNNVTYPKRYQDLKDYGYILINKNVLKLSDFI